MRVTVVAFPRSSGFRALSGGGEPERNGRSRDMVPFWHNREHALFHELHVEYVFPILLSQDPNLISGLQIYTVIAVMM